MIGKLFRLRVDSFEGNIFMGWPKYPEYNVWRFVNIENGSISYVSKEFIEDFGEEVSLSEFMEAIKE